VVRDRDLADVVEHGGDLEALDVVGRALHDLRRADDELRDAHGVALCVLVPRLDGGHQRPEGLGDVRVEGLVEDLVLQVERGPPGEAQDDLQVLVREADAAAAFPQAQDAEDVAADRERGAEDGGRAAGVGHVGENPVLPVDDLPQQLLRPGHGVARRNAAGTARELGQELPGFPVVEQNGTVLAAGDLQGQVGDDAEDVVVAHPEPLDEVVDEPPGRDLADLVAQLFLIDFAQQPVDGQQRLFPQVDVHLVEQLVDLERLRDEVDGPRLHGRHGEADGGEGGDQDDGDGRVDLADAAQEVHPVHARHVDVGDDEIIEVGAQGLQGLPAVGRLGGDVIASLPQGLDDEAAYGGVVVDHEDRLFLV